MVRSLASRAPRRAIRRRGCCFGIGPTRSAGACAPGVRDFHGSDRRMHHDCAPPRVLEDARHDLPHRHRSAAGHDAGHPEHVRLRRRAPRRPAPVPGDRFSAVRDPRKPRHLSRVPPPGVAGSQPRTTVCIAAPPATATSCSRSSGRPTPALRKSDRRRDARASNAEASDFSSWIARPSRSSGRWSPSTEIPGLRITRRFVAISRCSRTSAALRRCPKSGDSGSASRQRL